MFHNQKFLEFHQNIQKVKLNETTLIFIKILVYLNIIIHN